MKKQLSALFAAAALALVAACGASPTTPSTAAPDRALADEAPKLPAPPPQDTTAQRVPNMMGSGN